jgi:branched-chain amino acid transport system permease protein
MIGAEPTAATVAAPDTVAGVGRRPVWLWVVASAGAFALPFIPGLDGDFGRSLLSQMGISVIFALSFNMLLGQTGLLSFGHAVYFGLGGYVAVHFMRLINAGLPVPMPLVPLAGGLGGLFFGIVLGSVSTRRAGTVFAMITLGMGELVSALAFMLTRFFGGEEGITANRTKAPHLLGITGASQLQVYELVAVWVLLSVAAMYLFTRTPIGRMCNAVRDNPERAEFVGYDPQRVRFIAFAASAFFAGIAGGLHAINYEIVAAEAVGATRSGIVLLMAFIGGAGDFAGPILGAVLITWLQVSLSDFTTAWQLYLGIFFILMVLFVPGGLSSMIMMHRPAFRARLLGRLLPSYIVSLVPAVVIAVGASLLLEINYRLATKPELGTRMTLFWVPMDMSRPWPWAGALAVLGVGVYGAMRTWPRVVAAWQDVSERLASERKR